MCLFGPAHLAPERGPNFWRFLQDDLHTKQTNVTLLFEVSRLQPTFAGLELNESINTVTFAAARQRLQTWGQSYCVDGFVVERLSSTGSVVQKHIPMASSYSFEWNQLPETITMEAYNSLGSSSNNINMTLEKTPKRESAADNPSRSWV